MRIGYRIFSGKAKRCIGCKSLHIVYDTNIRKKELHCKLEDKDKINECLDEVTNYRVPDWFLAARHPKGYPFSWSAKE